MFVDCSMTAGRLTEILFQTELFVMRLVGLHVQPSIHMHLTLLILLR